MASEQAQVAGLFLSLSFRLQIGQFDAGMQGITPCSVVLKRHLKHPQGSLRRFPILLLRRGAIWRDRLSHTEYGREHLEDHAAVQNPDKISTQCSEERD